MAIADTPSVQSGHSMWAEPQAFKAHFNRSPFYLYHSLANHPLFEIPRLVKLAQSLKHDPFNYCYDAGDIKVDQRWNQRPANSFTLEESIERLDCAGAWVILKHTNLDPEYNALMNLIMADIERMTGRDLKDCTRLLEAQIMLTSPGRITPYHLDNECNVLLQIRGEKDIYVFDQTDREILTETELERFWVGDWNAGEYKARCQERARAFRLKPGNAVHIPVNAPHWLQNDQNISMSLSINFEWTDDTAANIYRTNHYLRKIGLKPNPPGRSRFRDAAKTALVSAGFLQAVDWMKRKKHGKPQTSDMH